MRKYPQCFGRRTVEVVVDKAVDIKVLARRNCIRRSHNLTWNRKILNQDRSCRNYSRGLRWRCSRDRILGGKTLVVVIVN
jgi:hypothetical protein